MTCETLTDSKGRVIGHICNRGQRRKMCADCKAKVATLECDYALRGRRSGHTCDRAICASCATAVERIHEITGGLTTSNTIDYCKAHAALAKKEEVSRG